MRSNDAAKIIRDWIRIMPEIPIKIETIIPTPIRSDKNGLIKDAMRVMVGGVGRYDGFVATM